MTTPSGPLALHLDALATAISKSSTFQTLIGGNEAAAKAKCLRATYDVDRPWALIFAGRGYSYDRTTTNSWAVNGRLGAVFEVEVTPDDPTDPINVDNELDKFDNAIGGICDDIMTLVNARTAGVLDIQSIRPQDGEFIEDDEGNQFIAGVVEFVVEAVA